MSLALILAGRVCAYHHFFEWKLKVKNMGDKGLLDREALEFLLQYVQSTSDPNLNIDLGRIGY